MSNFIHLKCHTEYSMRDGIVRIGDLIKTVKQLEMPAVAITDHSNLCGMVKFYKKATAAGVKPIIAADVIIRDGDERYTLSLYCQNQTGYQNLTLLLSRAYTEGQLDNGEPELQYDWFADCSEGLIALSGAQFGDVGQALLAGKKEIASLRLKFWLNLFPARFYIELQRTGRRQEAIYLDAAIALAEQYELPVVATNDVRFMVRDDFEAHEARVCIHDSYVLEDSNRPRRYSESQYLKTASEMQSLFSDLPEALENTIEIAKRCTCLIKLGDVFLPQFPVPKEFNTETYLQSISQAGLDDYLQN